jgi:hypothetical protein
VIIFARILKAKNPTSSWKLCRLRDEEIPDMVLQIELRILTRMNEDLSGSLYTTSLKQLVGEYLRRRNIKAKKYEDSSRLEFSQAVKKFHRLSREKLNNAKEKVYKEVFRGCSNFKGLFRFRWAYGSGPPPSPPTTTAPAHIEMEIDNGDAMGKNTFQDKRDYFRPAQLNMSSTANPARMKDESATNNDRDMDLNSNITVENGGGVDKSNFFRPATLSFGTTSNPGQATSGGIPSSSSANAFLQPKATFGITTNTRTPQDSAPSNGRNQTQGGPTSTNGVPTSKELPPHLLSLLHQPSVQMPGKLSVSNAIRGLTIEILYNALVNINVTIPKIKQDSAIAFLRRCVAAGVAPFWSDFIELTADKLAHMAKQTEGLVITALQKKMHGKVWTQAVQEDEYRQLALELGPKGTPDKLEEFTETAKKVVGKGKVRVWCGEETKKK